MTAKVLSISKKPRATVESAAMGLGCEQIQGDYFSPPLPADEHKRQFLGNPR